MTGISVPHILLLLDPVCLIALEELLIDFRELVGNHSGENLAHAVYNTLNIYGLKDHVSFHLIPAIIY